MDGNYFSLLSTVPAAGGAGTLQRRQIILYLGVLAGALSSVVYDFLSSGSSFNNYAPFFLALIASVVTFPAIYKTAGLNRGRITWAKWATAFQNGFFWSIIMDQFPGMFT